MARVTQLGYVGQGVSDVAAWERFATDMLGLELSERLDDGALLLRLDTDHYRIAVHPGGDDDLACQARQVADEHDLNAIAQQIRDFGAAVYEATPAEARRVRGLITRKDPDGFDNHIFYGPLMDFDAPFRPPRRCRG